jgi:hypothetical protein
LSGMARHFLRVRGERTNERLITESSGLSRPVQRIALLVLLLFTAGRGI